MLPYAVSAAILINDLSRFCPYPCLCILSLCLFICIFIWLFMLYLYLYLISYICICLLAVSNSVRPRNRITDQIRALPELLIRVEVDRIRPSTSFLKFTSVSNSIRITICNVVLTFVNSFWKNVLEGYCIQIRASSVSVSDLSEHGSVSDLFQKRIRNSWCNTSLGIFYTMYNIT